MAQAPILILGKQQWLQRLALENVQGLQTADPQGSGEDLPSSAMDTPYQLIIHLFECQSPLEQLAEWRSGYPSTPFLTLPVSAVSRNLIRALQQGLAEREAQVAAASLRTLVRHSPLDTLRRIEAGQFDFLEEIRPNQQQLIARFYGCLGLGSAKGEANMNQLSRKPKSLLAYMLHHGQRALHKDQLARQFWPDSYGSCRYNSLYVAIGAIKKWSAAELGCANLIEFHHDCYRLSPEIELISDYHLFQRHYRQGMHLARREEEQLGYLTNAYLLRAAPFLEDLCDQNWVGPIRAELEDRYQRVLDKLMVILEQKGCPEIRRHLAFEKSQLSA